MVCLKERLNDNTVSERERRVGEMLGLVKHRFAALVFLVAFSYYPNLCNHGPVGIDFLLARQTGNETKQVKWY